MWEGDPTLSGSNIRPERFLGPLGRVGQLECGLGFFKSLLTIQGPPQSSPKSAAALEQLGWLPTFMYHLV